MGNGRGIILGGRDDVCGSFGGASWGSGGIGGVGVSSFSLLGSMSGAGPRTA